MCNSFPPGLVTEEKRGGNSLEEKIFKDCLRTVGPLQWEPYHKLWLL